MRRASPAHAHASLTASTLRMRASCWQPPARTLRRRCCTRRGWMASDSGRRSAHVHMAQPRETESGALTPRRNIICETQAVVLLCMTYWHLLSSLMAMLYLYGKLTTPNEKRVLYTRTWLANYSCVCGTSETGVPFSPLWQAPEGVRFLRVDCKNRTPSTQGPLPRA